MRKIAALVVASVLLSSCVGIDSTVAVRDDGSGTLALTYRVSQLIVSLGVSETGASTIPLPLTRADFERSLESSGGKVRLTRFDRSEDEKDITIHVQLTFDSFDALARLDAFRDAQLKLSTEGDRHVFSQTIAKASTEPVSEESLSMMDALFSGYELRFALQAPRPIQSSTLGTLSEDRKTLTWSAPVRDVVTTRSDLVLSAGW
jgi:hypothetical protein